MTEGAGRPAGDEDEDDGEGRTGSFLPDGPTVTADPRLASDGSGRILEPAGVLTGRCLAQFEMKGLLGAGGFGEVYRARDEKLDRAVAVKVLPASLGGDAERRERFRREAVTASALNHPGICTVHDLVEAEGLWLIVMELVEGETLHERLRRGPMPAAEAAGVGIQVAEALGEAHRAGVLHRDVKCRNIALNRRGQAKVLDFGLAKLLEPGTPGGSKCLASLVQEGPSAGTPGYVSPEQLEGRSLDARSDLFSLGVVLYRMVTGELPFRGASKAELLDAMLRAEPRGFGDAEVPARLKRLIGKLLEADREKRPASADEVALELRAIGDGLGRSGLRVTGRAKLVLVAAGVVAVVAAGAAWARWSRERWALRAVPEIERRISEEEFVQAAELIDAAREVLPDDPTLLRLLEKATRETSVATEPPGAEVLVRPLDRREERWKRLGTTPVTKARLARDAWVWRVVREGFAPVEFIAGAASGRTVKLVAERDVPRGMVPVLAGTAGLGWPLNEAPRVEIGGFLVDRFEVTNSEFRAFLEAGGYEDAKYWKGPFEKDGRALSFDEAVSLFRDATGRPGPATWSAGTFPGGTEGHPVTGVSWFEAAAYAQWAGKSLPTAYHWYRAAQTFASASIVPGSNFRGAGARPVGTPGAYSGSGTSDMAGNAKEWCSNVGPGGTRLILGGGYGDPEYQFNQIDAHSPWSRQPSFGFRCVLLAAPPPEATAGMLEPPYRDYLSERPVSDEVFAAFKGLYAYDRTELNAEVEEVATTDRWVHQKATIDAAYAGPRLQIHLFLPRRGAPPYQPVVFFPGGYAYYQTQFDPAHVEDLVDFVPMSGRVLVYPIYAGTFERQDGLGMWDGRQLAKRRDRFLRTSMDLGRTLDYLEARPDIVGGKPAYLGFSAGGAIAPLLLGVEQRFRAAVLVSGGFWFRHPLPETDFINFVTRVKVPVLMLNDRYDNTFPPESSQVPLFRLLGTAEKDKKRIVYDTGHAALPRAAMIRETLAWLDRYLGPAGPATKRE